jgi:class 3 adenylate cyclase
MRNKPRQRKRPKAIHALSGDASDFDPDAGDTFNLVESQQQREKRSIGWLKTYKHFDLLGGNLDSHRLVGLLTNTSPTAQDLQKDIFALRGQLETQTKQLRSERATNKGDKVRLRKLKKILTELRKKQALEFLIARVTPSAEQAIVENEELRKGFSSAQRAFVISIDIRRSTDLMLKAKRPDLFAGFMTELCSKLEKTIKDELGVFDKFTGDGVLAFFPEFFSGKDAGYHAVAAAQQAIAIFTDCYERNRNSFSTVLRDVHLAVGIDYGLVHLMQITGGLTVVGNAVVYACRLSGGPAKTILLNQPAYEKIAHFYGDLFLMNETEIEIKHEGGVVCYEIFASNKEFAPAPPSWLSSRRLNQPSAAPGRKS